MSVIDLTASTSEADAYFNKFSVKADGSTDDTYIHTADVVFPIANTADAEMVGRLIPGAKEMYLRASKEDTNWKTSVTVTPEVASVHFELVDAKSGRVLFKGSGEVRSVTLRSSKLETKVTMKLTFGGQTAETSVAFTKLLRSQVHVVYSASQQQLFDRAPKAPPVLLPDRGDVACASVDGETVFGRVVEINDEGDSPIIVLDDFGIECEVNASDIRSFWTPSSGELDSTLKSYRARCTRRKIQPSWASITVAMGESFAKGEQGEGPHIVTIAIIERAVEAAIAATTSASAPTPAPDQPSPMLVSGEPGIA